MIRRIALQYEEGTPVDTILHHLDRSGTSICDYADINTPVKGLPKMAEYHEVYSWFLLYDEQKVYSCKSEFSPQEFIETASDALAATGCRTARLEYYQIFDNDLFVTEEGHLGNVDLTGNASGVKFMGSSKEMLSAYDDILSAVRDVPLALLSVICTYHDDPVTELQVEFTENVDAGAVFKDIIGQHPALRMMGCWIPERKGEPWYVYVSGSHSPRINTIWLPFDRTSGNYFYEELKRSKCWGDPDWLQGDIMIEIHKPRSGLATVNPFNWSNTVEIPEKVCGRKITTISLRSNMHLTRLIAPATVKKLGTYDLSKCIHLKEAVFPGVTEIKTTAFWDCKKLKDLWVSEKLKNVEPDAFPAGAKVTIHAPAGSFAQEYAKRKRFPFEPVA